MTPEKLRQDHFKQSLAEKIHHHRTRISDWYLSHAQVAPPPFYCSVDLRDSGHKIVPVDSNLFPAGFNNICPEDMRVGPLVLSAQVDAILGSKPSRKVVIIPEAHTSNLYYFENLHYLQSLFRDAGFEVRLAWFGPLPTGSTSPLQFVSQTGKPIEIESFEVKGGRLVTHSGFEPDWILLNNDFSSGYPTLLDGVTQPIVPSHRLGWHTRKKSDHFKYYNQLAREFAAIIDVDPWIFEIATEEVGPVNFNEGVGIQETAAAVDRILSQTQKAYAAHGIQQPPFAFVKNNAGTYGMGIMVVHNSSEVLQMNRRTKNKMSVGKNHLQIESMAVQEGVPTATLVDRLAAEPVIYLLGCELLGGFLRTNTEKGVDQNLNSQGMVFRKLCMSDLRRDEIEDEDEEVPVLETVYGAVARMSALATGLELLATQRNQNT